MLTSGPLRPVTSTQLPTSPSITVLLYDAARFHCAHARYAGSRVSKTLHALRAGLGSGDTEGSRRRIDADHSRPRAARSNANCPVPRGGGCCRPTNPAARPGAPAAWRVWPIESAR